MAIINAPVFSPAKPPLSISPFESLRPTTTLSRSSQVSVCLFSSSSSSVSLSAVSSRNFLGLAVGLRSTNFRKSRRRLLPPSAAMLLPQNPLLSDVCASVVSAAIAFAFLYLWEETAKRGLVDQVKIKIKNLIHTFIIGSYEIFSVGTIFL